MTTIDIDTTLDHRILFDCNNGNWEHSPEYNRLFVQTQARYLQMLLDRDTVLFVNDVLSILGFDRTPDGQVSGWYRPDGYLALDIETDGSNMWIIFKAQGIVVDKL